MSDNADLAAEALNKVGHGTQVTAGDSLLVQMAQVHATLAVADELAGLRRDLTGRWATTRQRTR